jgi:hypothetical protein
MWYCSSMVGFISHRSEDIWKDCQRLEGRSGYLTANQSILLETSISLEIGHLECRCSPRRYRHKLRNQVSSCVLGSTEDLRYLLLVLVDLPQIHYYLRRCEEVGDTCRFLIREQEVNNLKYSDMETCDRPTDRRFQGLPR